MLKTSFSKTAAAILLAATTFTSLQARDISAEEYKIYAAENYRVDYNKLNDADKTKLQNEYNEKIQLATIIRKQKSHDPVYEAALDFKTLDVWSRIVVAQANITEDILKDLYTKTDLKVAPKYKIRNILVKEDKDADDIIKSLSDMQTDKLQSKFIELVKDKSIDKATKDKDGDGGWVDVSTLPQQFVALFKDKSKGSIVKFPAIKDLGTQIVLIEDINPEHKASFEEAKNALGQIAANNAIAKAAQELMASESKQPAATIQSKKKRK